MDWPRPVRGISRSKWTRHWVRQVCVPSDVPLVAPFIARHPVRMAVAIGHISTIDSMVIRGIEFVVAAAAIGPRALVRIVEKPETRSSGLKSSRDVIWIINESVVVAEGLRYFVGPHLT